MQARSLAKRFDSGHLMHRIAPMLPKTVIYYGSNQEIPEPVGLVAGPLTMQFEPLTGLVRYVRIGDHEILRAIYAAVRDQNWATIPPRLSNVKQEIGKESFKLSFDVECQQGEIDYFWQGEIVGESDGTIRYSFDGQARSSFRRNRIGICVLHPIAECAGQPCRVEHSDAKEEPGTFPRSISPGQPFYDVRKISYSVAGVSAQVGFEGDEFEMEDQRNWGDASFKTYCTPQSRPKPAPVNPGDRVRQSVRLTLQKPVRTVLPVLLGRPPQISISTTPVVQLPPIGFCLERAAFAGMDDKGAFSPLTPLRGEGEEAVGQSLKVKQIERLRWLRPGHLRVDLRLSDATYPAILQGAISQSGALNTSLHVALIVSDNAERELRELARKVSKLKPRISLWLIFHEKEESIQERWVKVAREILQETGPALMAAGTLGFFTEFNRNRPPADATAFPCFSLNPQVHATDMVTMVENLAGHAMDVETAGEISPKPVVLSPITLKIRQDMAKPAEAGTTNQFGRPSLPPDVDPRQMSLFGAGWTLGSIARLATTGHVHSLTYFETIGWRGIMESENGSELSDKFPSLPGSVFPMYHVFADIAEFSGKQIQPTHSSHPLITEGLTLFDLKGRRRILVANLSNQMQEVKIKSGTCEGHIRYLDETNVERAMVEPENFRREAPEKCASMAGKIPLKLLPYGLARVDID